MVLFKPAPPPLPPMPPRYPRGVIIFGPAPGTWSASERRQVAAALTQIAVEIDQGEHAACTHMEILVDVLPMKEGT